MQAQFEYSFSELAVISIRLLVAFILLLAGCLKLITSSDLNSVRIALRLPKNILVGIGFRLVPIVEISAGLWLLVGNFITLALGIVLLLFSIFTLIVIQLLGQGFKGICACFGTSSRRPVSFIDLTRNIVLVIITAIACIQSIGNRKISTAIWQLPALLIIGSVILLLAVTVFYIFAIEIEFFLRAEQNRLNRK